MRKILSLIVILLTIGCCYAQQVPVYSQYIMNEFLINPATAGIDGMTIINLTGRKQWVGIRHTPEIYSASVTTRVLKTPFNVAGRKVRKAGRGRVGLGTAFISDRNGAISRTNVQFTYAYHIFLWNYQLSFGLKGLLTQFKIDESLVELRNQTDIKLQTFGKSSYIPDAGAGVNFSAPNAHIGLSVSNLLESTIKFGNADFGPSEIEHLRMYLLYGYYRARLRDRNWTFEPSILLRGNERLNFSADFSGRLIYRNEYWAGLSARTSGELVVLLGVRLHRLLVGYSFDYGFNKLSYRSYGSHEIVLALKLGDSIRRYRWLERY